LLYCTSLIYKKGSHTVSFLFYNMFVVIDLQRKQANFYNSG
jgi:hypothetical protein